MAFANATWFLWALSVLVCAFVAAALLRASNRAGTGFFLGILLGPIGVVVATILRLSPTQTPAEMIARWERAEDRQCPQCAEWVTREARTCRFCHFDLTNTPLQRW